MAHELAAVGGGYAWPSLTFSSDGKNSRVSARAQREEATTRQRVAYIENCDVEMSVPAMRDELLAFLDQTALRAEAKGETELAARVDTLRLDIAEKDIREYRIIEAMLGYDPNFAPAKLMERFCSLSLRMRMDILEEIASGLNPLGGWGHEEQIHMLEKAINAANAGVSAKVRLELSERPLIDNPWEYGRELARQTRRLLGLLPDKIMDAKALLECLGLVKGQLAKIQETGRIALCHKKRENLNINFQSTSRHAAIPWLIKKRFQLARILGAFLVSANDDDWLAISASSTWNQQVQRNFASELLAPLAGILEMLPTCPQEMNIKDTKKIARHFDVSPRTIIHSLVNQNRITSEKGEALMAYA